MSKSKLLKEAIADAKAVRDTAMLNAKAALEEAFTPKLQSMISAKLQQEMDDEDMEGEDEYEDEMGAEDDVAMDAEMGDDTEAPIGDEVEDEMGAELGAEDEDEMEEEFGAEDGVEDEESTEEFEDEEDLELEAILRELEGEEESTEEFEDEESTEDEYVAEDVTDESVTENDDINEDDIDINEIIAALREDDSFTGDGTPDGDADIDSVEDEVTESTELTAELEEAYNTIKVMRDSLNETNLLNAKLLFSNKLFKAYDLNEGQKLKVIDNFDRAMTLREVKLVYATLAESMKTPAKRKVNESASRVGGSTAPKKAIINEGNDFQARMKKLAGIK